MQKKMQKKMQENNDGRLLKRELKEKLDWYTMYASEKEYDEKAVESILYLLDSVDPLEEGEIPSTEEAWERFRKMDKNQRELLSLDEEKMADGKLLAEKGTSMEGEIAVSLSNGTYGAATVKSGKAGDPGTVEDNAGSNERKPALRKGKIIKFVLHYKAVVAALFLVAVIAVGGSIQAGAIRNDGFFFWLNRDETGTEMITSPTTLDGKTSEEISNIFYDRNDMPEWAQDWLEIEEEYEMPDNYEWQYFEAMEFDFAKYVNGHYLDKELEREILLGVYIYNENVFYNRDGFIGYNYIDSYEINQKQIDIYSREEESGVIYYTLCFYEGNCKYSIRGQDELEGLKELANRYWSSVKNNLYIL